jgi:glycosyltransferase involved in cell wall biosynthesis
MRVALVHDYLTQFGGAERVLLALMELFPNAPVFTLVHDQKSMIDSFDQSRVRTSFLQRLPGARRHHRFFPLLMPLAIEQFDFSGFDVVLSDSHSFGKGIITGPNTMHVSYCFTPIRYAWDDSHRYVREFSSGPWLQHLAPMALSYIRLWDYYAAQRVDSYITLSEFVARRIKKYYGRESIVIPPPINVESFNVSQNSGDYFLIVSRLVPYKRIDLAIDACEKLGVPLKVVGTGPEENELRRRAGKWTEFLGFVLENELPDVYAGAKALLFPQEEDFGITPLEAAACGKPTIAYGAGGALETVVEEKTGLFFAKQDMNSLADAISRFSNKDWNSVNIREHAELFRKDRFLHKIQEEVHNQWMAFKRNN